MGVGDKESIWGRVTKPGNLYPWYGDGKKMHSGKTLKHVRECQQLISRSSWRGKRIGSEIMMSGIMMEKL